MESRIELEAAGEEGVFIDAPHPQTPTNLCQKHSLSKPCSRLDGNGQIGKITRMQNAEEQWSAVDEYLTTLLAPGLCFGRSVKIQRRGRFAANQCFSAA